MKIKGMGYKLIGMGMYGAIRHMAEESKTGY
jgi:hypothetical protein